MKPASSSVSESLCQRQETAPRPLGEQRRSSRADAARRAHAPYFRPELFRHDDIYPLRRSLRPLAIEIAEDVVRDHFTREVAAPVRILEALRRRQAAAATEAEREQLHELDTILSARLHQLADLYAQLRAAIHAEGGR
jgi:hypothetical protein